MGVFAKRSKTKIRRRERDVDQIKADLLSARHLEKHKETKAVEELPGLGRHYCIECAKWFETEHNLVVHRKGKPHRRRVKQLREEPDPFAAKAPQQATLAGFETASATTKTQQSHDVEMAS